MQKLNANAAYKKEYGTVLTDLTNIYKEAEPYFYVRDAYNETVGNCEILSQALNYLNLEKLLTSGTEEQIKKETGSKKCKNMLIYN